MKKYKELMILKKAKNVCLIGHVDPDADALCSMSVLRNILKSKFNVEVDLFAETNGVADNYKEIISETNINVGTKDYDVAIILDCPNIDRIGKYVSLYNNAKTKIVIDHHDTNKYQGDINIVEVCSSACEVVFAIGESLGYRFTSKDYGKIYAGIITDTGNFSVGRISERTFEIASKCTPNINYERIYRNFFSNNTAKNMRLFALAIDNMKTYENDKIIITHISKQEAEQFDAGPDDYTGIINRIATIGNSRLVAFIHPKGDGYYVSMRARLGYDVSKIAVSHGGGGHVGAAAFLIGDDYEDMEKELKTLFQNELNNNQESDREVF